MHSFSPGEVEREERRERGNFPTTLLAHSTVTYGYALTNGQIRKSDRDRKDLT
jgi:hypothetical protein